MPESRFYDYLIVGQGLAGSLLAWRLLRAGKRPLVVDDTHHGSSSMVAAGVINPLAGKRFNHSPLIHSWLTAVHTTYGQLGKQSGMDFWQPMAMWRLFREPEQYRFYDRLPPQTAIRSLIGERFSADAVGQPIHAPLGGFIQHQTGYVRLPALLAFLGNWLEDQHALQRSQVEYTDLHIYPNHIRYANYQARHIVFCDGYRGMHNPWFNYLPFAPDKGEILTLQQLDDTKDGQLPNRIINSYNWLLPIDGGKFRLGSTHNHEVQDDIPSTTGVSALMEGLNKLLLHPQQLQLLRSEAGVRPATSDRQPFLGTHPAQPRLHIFNGFGAHGSLTIPWYSQQMLDWLEHQQRLPAAADIHRYRALAGC